MTKSTPGGPAAFFTRSPAISFFPLSSSPSEDPTTGFSDLSKVDKSLNTSSSGFCLLKVFFFLLDLIFI